MVLVDVRNDARLRRGIGDRLRLAQHKVVLTVADANALQFAITGAVTAIFDGVSPIERDVDTVKDALALMHRAGTRLGL